LWEDRRRVQDRDPNAEWQGWLDVHGPTGLDLGRGPRLAASDLVLRAAQQGQGIALARLRLAADSLRSGALVRLSQDRVDMPGAYSLIGRSDHRPSHAVRAVWAWLLDAAAQDPIAAWLDHREHRFGDMPSREGG